MTLLDGPYRTIVADPPWQPTLHQNNNRRLTKDKAGPQKFYPTLSVDEIISLKPNMDKQCHLYIWGINAHFDWTYLVARAWGADPVTVLTWNKPGLGVGRFQCNTEHILVARKGPALHNPFGRGGRNAPATGGTRFEWPRGKHSEKPQEFFDLVEKLSPGPMLEMYARAKRPGWAVWGNESDGLTRIKGLQEEIHGNGAALQATEHLRQWSAEQEASSMT